MEHWARISRNSRSIPSKKAARNSRRRKRKRQERWKNSDFYKEQECKKVASVILAEREERLVHYAPGLAGGIMSLNKRSHCRPILGIDRSCLGLELQMIEEPFDNPWRGKRIVFE